MKSTTSTASTASNATSVKPMVIELRKVQEYPRLSEETTAFSADLYIDGVKRGTAENEGKGGSTNYGSFGKSLDEHHENSKFIKLAEQYCLTLPPKKYEGSHGMNPFEVAMNLENYIDSLLDVALASKDQAKFNKKLDKDMATGIMYGVPNKQYRGTMCRKPISELLKTPEGIIDLKNDVVRIKAKIGPGEKILNTNLPADILAATELIPVAPKLNEKAIAAMQTNIVYGTPDFKKVMGLDLKNFIAVLLQTDAGKNTLISKIELVKKNLKRGEIIFNTNIPAELL